MVNSKDWYLNDAKLTEVKPQLTAQTGRMKVPVPGAPTTEPPA